MKKTILTITLVATSLVACKKEEQKNETPQAPVATETQEETETTVMPDSTAIANAWSAYMTPSQAHENLAKETGKWTAEMKFWNAYTPDAPAETMQSTAEYKMILDNHYQEGIYKGEMWGMPFEGRSIVAFDNAKQEYISTWIDNMGTGLMVMRGTLDKTSNTVTLQGTMYDPVLQKDKKQKEVITYIDEDTQKMEMFDIDDNGKEFKTMEILSKRVK